MRTSLLAAVLLVFNACAQQSGEQALPEATTVSINIPSAQCGMCKNAITKALTSAEGIQDVSVDLDAKTVSVSYASAALSLEDLESIISKAGYDANDLKADPDAYDKLPECCKLPEDEEPMETDSM